MLHRRRRPGFTLLEVILATTIAVLLLGALYVAVDMQLGYAQMSRDVVEESTLARSVFARMDDDASHVVALCDPARFRPQDTSNASNGQGMNSGSPTGQAAGANQTANTGQSTAQNTGTTSGTGSSTDSGVTSNVVLPLGVMGDSETLHLFVSNLPREIYSSGSSFGSNNGGDVPPVSSDLRRISYWLVGGGDSPAGLARQEVPLITSEDALQNLPPGVDDETSFIIADEVRALSFQYWDGNEWQDSWDSTEMGPDGLTPIGSPLAIGVTIAIAAPRAPGSPPGQETVKTYHHLLFVPTANGLTLQTQAQSGATTNTNTGQQSNQSTMNGGGASP
jgi:prepilin-type N-terminal cleavage/methylation domain-containing protein